MGRLRTPRRVRCGIHFHVIRTESLVLRTPTLREAKLVMAGASDDEAQRWLGWEDRLIWPSEHRAAALAATANGLEWPTERPIVSLRHLVAIDPDRLTIVGSVGFEPSNDAGHNHIGGWLAPQYRGRGLGRELFAAGLALGHQHLAIKTINAGAEESNTASRRSLEAAGFRPIDGAPTHTLPDGRAIASCWYEHTAPATAYCKGKRR